MQIAATHFLPLTLVRRTRLLATAGKVLVHPGQKVNTTDVIAEANQQGQRTLIDVRRAMGVVRADEAQKLIERQVGERIQKDDILAQSQGVFARVLRSPVDGVISFIIGGHILIESVGAPVQLLAGFAGTVVDVSPDFGATIETAASLVQGIWGNDRFDQGTLLMACSAVDSALTREDLDVSMRGAVVIGGYCSQADVIKMAAEMPLRGLVLSSVDAHLLPLIKQAPYPVCIIEGIGRLPYNSFAFKLLSANSRRDTCIKACMLNSTTGERPEVIIPLPAAAEQPNTLTDHKAGKKVRIIGAPYASRIGTLVQVRPGLTRLSNGVNATCADVRLENDEVVQAPLANLDVLE